MISIRPIKTADLSQIAQIECESFSDPYPLHLFQYLAEITPNLFLVAVENEVVLGYIVAEIRQDSELKIGQLLSLAVRRVERRKGVGHQLFLALLEVLKEQSCKEVILEVRVSNYSAKIFYERHGFRKLKRSRKYYKDGEDALIMGLKMEDQL